MKGQKLNLYRRSNRIAGHPIVKKIIVFGVVSLICLGIASIVITTSPQPKTHKNNEVDKTKGMPVTVKTTSPGDFPARITSLGEVTPRYRSTIKARVPGRIVFLSERLQEGMIVGSGDVLVGIEKSVFLAQVAEAESRLKTARLNVLKEEREATDAEKNWKRSGIKGPPSRLVLRKPHLEAALANLKAAKSALANARVQLGHSEIRAPYDGVVMKRSVNPGEMVFAGDEVATLYSLSAVEVGIHLDAAQWSSLSTPIETTTARLTDPRQKAAWDAVVVRKSMHLDRETRLRKVFLEVKDPLNQTPPLLPGTFVRVELTGKEMAGLLCIPEAAQTKAGFVWFVDSQNRLTAHRTEPVFFGEGLVYIQNPKPKVRSVRVAVSPNASFTNGLLVQPFEEDGNI